jgi:hypothetical protein
MGYSVYCTFDPKALPEIKQDPKTYPIVSSFDGTYRGVGFAFIKPDAKDKAQKEKAFLRECEQLRKSGYLLGVANDPEIFPEDETYIELQSRITPSLLPFIGLVFWE